MTLSFPLSLNTFADKLKITTVQWQLKRWDQLSGMGTGDVIAAQLAPPRISGIVTLGALKHDDAAEVQAVIESLDGPMQSFYLYAPQKPFPRFDPDGSKLGAATVTTHTVGANNKSLRLQGLPSGYVLSVGDYLAFDYGTNPVRRGFHRIVEAATAPGSSITPLFEVRPHLRPGVTTGLAVTLIKPAAKVFIVPETFDPGTARALITEGMQFEVMQRP